MTCQCLQAFMLNCFGSNENSSLGVALSVGLVVTAGKMPQPKDQGQIASWSSALVLKFLFSALVCKRTGCFFIFFFLVLRGTGSYQRERDQLFTESSSLLVILGRMCRNKSSLRAAVMYYASDCFVIVQKQPHAADDVRAWLAGLGLGMKKECLISIRIR